MCLASVDARTRTRSLTIPTTGTPAYGPHSTAQDIAANYDLHDRTVIITGATTGIGVETARSFASTGACVIIGVRDLPKGEGIARAISASTGNKAVHALYLDLSDLGSVGSFANAVRQKTKVVHYLINNAGIADAPLQRTAQGYELHFATNHLGHFLLFDLLVDCLKEAEASRVISLTSAAHRHAGIDFDDIHFRHRAYDSYTGYAQSKTATALFSVAISARYLADGIASNSVMPGVIVTELIGIPSPERLQSLRFTDESGNLKPYVKSIAQGAATTLWAALSSDLDGIGGQYLEDCARAKPWSRESRSENPWVGFVPHAVCPEAAERLWVESGRMIRE
jgi:NAD(P)-dependent dehydrogenase (short-subunit alcohol dehydrogenase family)